MSHDWLELVGRSGLVISEPVLDEVLPHGPDTMRRGLWSWFRSKHARYEIARQKKDAAGQQRWRDFVLETLLERPASQWTKTALPASCRTFLESHNQELAADRAAFARPGDDKPGLLVRFAAPDQDLDRKETTAGRWRASPTTKLERLLRDTGVPLGLVTNGEAWRLVFAPAQMTTGHLTWTASTWIQERSTLDAFLALLGKDRLFATQDGLADCCALSRDRQGVVADQLGGQVRDGLEVLIKAWDAADRRSEGQLLAGMELSAVYEMGLVVMMRLVFLLYAEERHLLPHGELVYDRGYGVTWLWQRLARQHREDHQGLDTSTDAWDRWLATCRLVHGGSTHPDLTVLAYGGSLFDPGRFPALEDAACRLSNRVLYEVLRRLLFARQRRGGGVQRVGYWALDVEQIGYIYEGLLDHRCARAGQDAMVKLRGGGEDAVELGTLEALDRDALVAEVVRRTGRKADTIWQTLDDGPELGDSARVAGYPPDVRERALRLAPILQLDELAPAGWRYVTTGTSRREAGAQYTPQHLTGRVVSQALECLVYETSAPGVLVEPRRHRAPRELLALRVCDPAMGSGAFLVQVVRYLGEHLLQSWHEAALRHGDVALSLPFADPVTDRVGQALLNLDDEENARRQAMRLVAERCVFGVDINPLATEMARLSLWLVTLARDREFTFVDHALRTGDALLGATLEQIERFSIDEAQVSQLPLASSFSKAVNEAARARRELESVLSAPGEHREDDKRQRLQDADDAVERAARFADLLVGTWLTGGSKRERDELAETYRVLIRTNKVKTDPKALRGRRPLHWELVFPEVFAEGGFSALVGNPPFMGGKKITGHLGRDYREWLVEVLGGGQRGHADLVAYFFLRALDLVRPGGRVGLVATNTIAQGDTREVGLEQLVDRGGTLTGAVPSMPWPGQAHLEVAIVHLSRGAWDGPLVLDGHVVERLTPLLDDGTALGTPHRLEANAGLSFIGSYVLGLGFTMAPDEAQALIADDPRRAQVLKPYLNGKELNSHPRQEPSRWVIDFRDYPLDRSAQGKWVGAAEKKRKAWLKDGRVPADYPDAVAADWPALLAKLERDVKPERTRLKPNGQFKLRKPLPQRWWQHADKRPALYEAIARMERVLVKALVSSTHAPSPVAGDWVYAHKLVVFGLPDLGVVQTSMHEAWAWKYSSTMRADLNYSPSNCFETFPFPDPDPEADLPAVAAAAHAYEAHRAELMAPETGRNIGLTKAYNLFHDPECLDDDVVRFRALHIALDQAVAQAYGWDFPLDHGWQKTVTTTERRDKKTGRMVTKEKVTWRYTLGEAARKRVLRELLELNHQRYAEEQAQAAAPVQGTLF